MRDGVLVDPLFAQPTWWICAVLLAVDTVLGFLSFGFAAQSKIAPLGAAAILVNSVLVPMRLGKPIRRRESAGAWMVVVGTPIAVGLSNPGTPSYALNDIKVLFETGGTVAYLVFSAALLAAMVVGCHHLAGRRQGHEFAVCTKLTNHTRFLLRAAV